jgi:hypothetical protein
MSVALEPGSYHDTMLQVQEMVKLNRVFYYTSFVIAPELLFSFNSYY